MPENLELAENLSGISPNYSGEIKDILFRCSPRYWIKFSTSSEM